MTHASSKERAHDLIDLMAPGQVSAVVGLLEVMLDPMAQSLANAPYDDEPVSDEETLTVAASKAWLKNNKAIPHEVVLAEFGLTPDDFERMGWTPLDTTGKSQ